MSVNALMTCLAVTAVAMVLAMLFFYCRYIKFGTVKVMDNNIRTENNNKLKIVILLGASLLIKIIISGMTEGYEPDLRTFKLWGERILQVGYKNFYDPELLTDYPPGYLYILGFLSWVCKFFKIGLSADTLTLDYTSLASNVVFKFPAVLCDIATAYMIYKIAKRRLADNVSMLCAALYIYNPAVMINAAVWGQVDSIYVFLLVLMLYFIIEHKLYAAYIIFGIGIMFKPQMIFFTPILIWAIVEQVFLNSFSSGGGTFKSRLGAWRYCVDVNNCNAF